MMRSLPLVLMTAAGTIGFVIFAYYAMIDWAALDAAYANFAALTDRPPDLTTLFAAEAYQHIHRTNTFAEGVWALQSAIIAAIGLHGLCTVRR